MTMVSRSMLQTRSSGLRRLAKSATWAALLALANTLGGCSLFGSSNLAIGANDPNEPTSLVDSFLIARGMEFSYGRSGRATPQQIAQLIQYDHAALVAVLSAERRPGYDLNLKAQHALQALVDYTAANDLAAAGP